MRRSGDNNWVSPSVNMGQIWLPTPSGATWINRGFTAHPRDNFKPRRSNIINTMLRLVISQTCTASLRARALGLIRLAPCRCCSTPCLHGGVTVVNALLRHFTQTGRQATVRPTCSVLFGENDRLSHLAPQETRFEMVRISREIERW